MNLSRFNKKNDKNKLKNDLIISEDIETTESYAGVGGKNIVNCIENEKINYSAGVKCDINKSYSHSKTPQFDSNRNLQEYSQRDLISVSDDSKSNKSNNDGIKIRLQKNEISKTDENRLPQLAIKSGGSEPQSVPEVISTINDQIEKLENRKLKLSISEKQARMKELLSKGRQNWSNFKSEINFIKSVESNSVNKLRNDSEYMIKDEKLLNVFLNDIVIGEKENLKSDLAYLDLNKDENLNFSNDVMIEKNLNSQSDESIEINSVIKPMKENFCSNQISADMAMDLKHLLFNSTSRSWGSEWYKQNFDFHSINTEVFFGIIQKSRGPNNVMAAVQAEFLIEALFRSNFYMNWFNNIKKNKHKILSLAMSNIISRCRISDSNPINICLLDSTFKGKSIGVVKPDGITECLVIYEIFDKESLNKFILHHINQFTDPCNPGLILLIVSCLITHGLNNCKNELSNKTMRLINPLGVSSDELMSLIIHGYISSHCFNEYLEIIDSDSNRSLILRGISKRSSIGYFTLDNHCEYCQQIGTYLKTPKYPVWLVKWKNDNYCVMFCHNQSLISDWKSEIRFTLHIYSPLFQNEKLISLTIDASSTESKKQKIREEEKRKQMEKEKENKRLTENRLKKMSEKTLKFLLEDCSIEDYLNENVHEKPGDESDLQYLDKLIHIKWSNATITLEDNEMNISKLFKN